MQNFSLIGFPKCATSSIWQYFAISSSLTAAKAPTGSIEFDITENSSEWSSSKLHQSCFVKYSSAIYSTNKLKKWDYLRSQGGASPVYIISYSTPTSRLLSWFEFHQSIARTGLNKSHFAYKERDKILTMDLEKYFLEYGSRLDYAKYISGAVENLQREILVLNVKNIASSMPSLINYLNARGCGFAHQSKLPVRNKTTALATMPRSSLADTLSSSSMKTLKCFEDRIEALHQSLPSHCTWI